MVPQIGVDNDHSKVFKRSLVITNWLVIFLFLTCFILWLAPNVRLDWTVVGYIFYRKVFLSLFLTIDYYLKRKWWLSLATEKSRLLYKNI